MEDGRGEEFSAEVTRNGWLGFRECPGIMPRWSPATFAFFVFVFPFFSGGLGGREGDKGALSGMGYGYVRTMPLPWSFRPCSGIANSRHHTHSDRGCGGEGGLVLSSVTTMTVAPGKSVV